MNFIHRLSAFLIVLFLPMSALAKTVFIAEGETETIPIVRDETSILRFSSEVKTITQVSRFKIEPADSDAPDYATLAVTSRFSNGEAKVTFLLASGEAVSIRFVVVSKPIAGKTDSFFDIKKSEERIELAREGAKVNELQLMKAMLNLDDLKGFKIKKLSQRIEQKLDGFSVVLEYQYLGPRYVGQIFRITNSQKKTYSIDLTKLSWGSPNRALLAQVDAPRLEPNESTLLRVVTPPSGPRQNIYLPTGTLEGKENEK